MGNKGRPGVMLYFDVRPCIKRLTTEEKGQLFEAILDYGELGVFPEFEGMLGIAWDFISPRLDRDSEAYGLKISKSKYAVFVREVRKHGQEPLSFEEWLLLTEEQREQMLSGDTERYPTTNPDSTTDSYPTTTSKETTAKDKKLQCPAKPETKTADMRYNDLRLEAIEKLNAYGG